MTSSGHFRLCFIHSFITVLHFSLKKMLPPSRTFTPFVLPLGNQHANAWFEARSSGTTVIDDGGCVLIRSGDN